jgi:uncharacterized protein (TIGR00730 family)
MGRLAEAVHQHGGKIIGVIPAMFVERALAYEKIDELVVTSDMRERKTQMEKRADAFITLPGGFGTLEELLEILTLKQLLLHNKPIVILNRRDYFGALLGQFERMFAESFAHSGYRALYHVADNAVSALNLIEDEHAGASAIPEKWAW